jgi:hypothetical protein
MRSSTTGKIPDYSDAKNPHRGSHPEINKRVEQLNNDYVKSNGITAQNKMTEPQARQLEGQIRRDPQVREFLAKIRAYQVSKTFEYARHAYSRTLFKQPGE